jgi:prepilin signal peptidase PulO-like enzyme (type II secretory pathway)
MMVAAFGFIFGSILGSFTEAVVDRAIRKESFKGRSYCLHCKHTLQWYDLFPVFSYLFLKGKCRYCHKKVALQDLIVEVIMGLLFALLLISVAPQNLDFLNSPWETGLLVINTAFKSFAVVILAIIFLVDLKTGLILDRITYPATVMVTFLLIVLSGIKSYLFYDSLLKSVLGKYLMPPYSNYLWSQLYRVWEPVFLSIISAFVGAAVFILLIVITRGRGMGWGDVKYVFFLGLVLGFPNIVAAVFLAFLSGAVVSLLLVALNKKHFGQTVPFGPFLSFGAFIALIWGSQIFDWYFNHLMLIF